MNSNKFGEKLIVQKFGGSSLATSDQIKKIAARIAEQHRAGFRVIAVVSAMGKTTDGLMKLAHEISAVPNRRELDMLLSAGERISMALLSMALHDLNCPSISFTGSQAGVMTDGSHSNATIQMLKPIRVDEALTQNKVVVLAGFQGVDPQTKEITTLGRGGSDTTAVAMAAHFKAARCEILKDVDGVLSADPRIIPEATLLKEVNGAALAEMCRWGAKVLHHRSVEVAVKDHVALAIGRSDNFSIGTRVTYNGASTKPRFIAVNSLQEVHQLEIEGASAGEANKNLYALLDQNKLPYPEILTTELKAGRYEVSYASDIDTLNAIKQTFAVLSQIQLQKLPLAAATLTAAQALTNPTEAIKPLEQQLEAAGIRIYKKITTPHSLSFFVDQELRIKAAQILHSGVLNS